MSDRIPLQTQRHWWATKAREMGRHLGSSQKARLRWLVAHFAAPPGKGATAPPNTTEVVAFLIFQSGAAFYAASMPRLRPADLVDLARQVSDGLARVVDGEQWKVEVRERLDRILVRRARVRDIEPDEPYGARTTWQPRSPRALSTVFLLVAGDLIERQQRWLARCHREDCRRIFVRDDVRQNYCSSTCSQTQRTRRFRATKGS
jgi:hypothetical protein